MYRPSHRILPDAPTGYPLVTPQGRSRWGILQPVASTNLFLNPSVEVNLTGYGSFSGSETITRVTTQQRRGSYAIQVVTSASTNRGLVANNGGTGFLLTAGVTYTVSVDVWGTGGVPYLLYLSGPLSSQPGTLRFIGRGRWERQVLTFTPTQTGAHNINLLKENSASTAPWWVDGWQLEQLPYATTYFDGDTVGYEYDYLDLTTGAEKPKPYQWLGTPHASTSRRLVTTRSGGRRRSFDDFGLIALGATGAGLPPMLISSARFANGGGRFQRAIPDVRALLIAGVIYSSSALGLQAQAAPLMPLLNPEYGPATLVYQDHEDNEEAYIPVVYQSGLELDITNDYRLDVPLSFEIYGPMTRGYDVSASLNYTQDLTNANYVVQRPNGLGWSNMANGLNANVLSMTESEGIIYAGTDVLAGTAYLYRWTGSAWSQVATSTSGIFALAPRLGGGVYYATPSQVFSYDGSTSTALAATGMQAIYRIRVATDGSLWIAGIEATGVPGRGALRRYNGASWSTIAWSETGAGKLFFDMAIDLQSNTVYVVGTFNSGISSAGTTVAANVFALNTTTNAITALDTGGNAGLSRVTLYNGSVVVGGKATTIGGINRRVAAWNGSAWNSITANDVDYDITALYATNGGTLYIGGYKPVGTTGPDLLHVLNRGVWQPLDIDLPGVPTVAEVIQNANGDVTVAFQSNGTAQSAVTAVNNSGSDIAYPTVTFTGPGQLYQLRNYTTNDVINFDNLVLNTGETATLTLSQGGVLFESNFRGSLLGYIGPGSNPASWNLAVGSNNVSSFMTSTTANSSILLKFKVPLGKL